MKFIQTKAALAVIVSLGIGCDQYDPSSERELFEEERVRTSKPVTKLTETGEIPKQESGSAALEVSAEVITEKYGQFCASCHGDDGRANTATAAALVPKPRNLTDKNWQASVDDNHITKVIKEGGGSVGLSATMAPWAAVLSDQEIAGMVKLIREWGN